ncbi:hypothetical protein [Thalassoglobus polymorphus]|uniref:Uncharacterized protein n=1 Tax=Thalassoglobus polymorphus TaxID=2527994 RepID=A0A517QQM5_9PLAN|nr:hypothetical protein [Thalassoglobus polymorphus]QDT33898.1 hypothetical protein Mal48_31540 [Thalassoglobus polymorphus]
MINPHVDRTATANKICIDLVEPEFTSVLRGEFEIEEIIAVTAVNNCADYGIRRNCLPETDPETIEMLT